MENPMATTFTKAQQASIDQQVAAAVAAAIAGLPKPARRENTGELFPSKPDKDYVFDGPLDVGGQMFHIWARESKYHDGYFVSIAVSSD
jgi:hypothetical protein